MSLEDYEPVAVRLSRLLTHLRTDGLHPRIITNMLSAPGADVCVFRAELWLDDMLMATGHAEEVRGQGNVNKTSHVENCETSSLGRMCESFAPTSDHTKRPSREEMQKVERRGDVTITSPANTLSEAQERAIRAICKSMGRTVPSNLQSLTKQQASQLIDQLKNGTPAPAEDESPEEPF